MKRFLRFNLRWLFIVFTLVTLIGGTEFLRQTRQRAAVLAIRNVPGCSIGYDYDVTSPEWIKHLPTIRSTVAGWIHQVTGNDFFNPAVRLWLSFDANEPSVVRHVSGLTHLRWLHLAPSGLVPHDGLSCPPLEPLIDCNRLEYLVLGSWVNLRPEGTPPFNGTGTTLLALNLEKDDIEQLCQLTKLRVLAVGGPTVNDETITKLAALPQLQYLYLSHADISGEIVTELNESQPNLTIIRMDDRSHDYSAEINSRF